MMLTPRNPKHRKVSSAPEWPGKSTPSWITPEITRHQWDELLRHGIAVADIQGIIWDYVKVHTYPGAVDRWWCHFYMTLPEFGDGLFPDSYWQVVPSRFFTSALDQSHLLFDLTGTVLPRHWDDTVSIRIHRKWLGLYQHEPTSSYEFERRNSNVMASSQGLWVASETKHSPDDALMHRIGFCMLTSHIQSPCLTRWYWLWGIFSFFFHTSTEFHTLMRKYTGTEPPEDHALLGRPLNRFLHLLFNQTQDEPWLSECLLADGWDVPFMISWRETLNALMEQDDVINMDRYIVRHLLGWSDEYWWERWSRLKRITQMALIRYDPWLVAPILE